ncbi:MAG: AAA family ATPase [Myxococcota bacterium]|nr:AAA family ATPase [Myxococcota bacterium]
MINGQPVRAEQRFTKNRRCPICGGCAVDPRGQERRCIGFASDDGDWVHCSREEHAGPLPVTIESSTYAHRLRGECRCGVVHGVAEPRQVRSQIVAVYQYRDEANQHVFDVVRFHPKDFRQRRADGAWKMEGVRLVPYRLPELIAAGDEYVFVVEGEKDVDNLRAKLGAVATCNPGGALKWKHIAEVACAHLANRHVCIIPDGDERGRQHAREVVSSLLPVAASVRVLDLGAHDASDWIAAGGSAERLQAIADATEPVTGIEGAEPDAQPDPWARDLSTALADVKGKLDASKADARDPLFDGDAVSLLAQHFDGARWLVTGLVTRGGITMIGAEPKVAKTWIALELAVAIATGTKACGEFYAEAGRAAYFFAEDLDVQARNRVRALLAGADRRLAEGRLFLRTRGVFLDVLRDADMAWIVASARRIGQLDVLVLDPLRDIHSGEEDRSDSMRDVMRRLRVLAELLGCTVVVVHHAPKATKDTAKRRPGQNLRGSGAIHGSVDSGIYLEHVGGDGTNVFSNVVVSQVKGARSTGAFKLDLTIADDDIGEAVSARWAFTRGAAKSDKVMAKENRDREDDRTILSWVRGLAIRGLCGSRRWLREHEERPAKVSEPRVRASLDRLIEVGSLVLIGSDVRIPQPDQGDAS